MKKSVLRVISQIPRVDETELPSLKKRLDIVTAVVLCMVGVLALRLWYLQIHMGADYRQQSERNRTRVLSLPAPRGNILDRNGRLLVTNRPSFNVVWTRDDAPSTEDQEAIRRRLATLLAVDLSTILDRCALIDDLPKYTPITLAEDIDWPTLARIENRRFALPGIRIEARPIRRYPEGDIASHLLGYIGAINGRELRQRQDQGYTRNDLIGKKGIERVFEDYLRGEKGRRYIEVDARGYEQQVLAVREPLPGDDIVLTIDAGLQRTAEQALAGQAGAVVAMEVRTGRLLVLASAPALPISRFVGRIPPALWNRLRNDPLRPFPNKPIQDHYPPGSTYKIVTAMAGLSEGVITPETVFYCAGSLKVGNTRFGCWKRGGHGAVSLRRALAESCDVYFYLVGQKLGVDRLAAYARSFGLGQRSGIELEHEASGLVPTTEWKRRVKREPWHEGETLNVAIGQGANLATPLQICMMTAATANGGTVYQPQFVERINKPDGTVVRRFTPRRLGTVKGDHRFLRVIRKALVAAVNTRHATGALARLHGITVAGKTGTTQVAGKKKLRARKKGDEIPYHLRDHAWFTCYAPAERPEIAVTVLVEHGGHGGSTAAPVARKVLARYFGLTPDATNTPE